MSGSTDPKVQEDRSENEENRISVIPPVDSEPTEIRSDGIFSVASHAIPSSLPADSLHELVGQNLDHYRIESLVGVGGMGAVFRGRDLRLDRVVAIKVVAMSHRRADAMRRFRIEAQSAAKLDHPNIARVFYVGETDRWSYIVFEFIEGTNLRQLVLERGLLTVDDATYFTCQVAEALQHAQDRGVVHRDIKPSNILIGKDGKARIVDMGLARTTELDRSTGDLTASGVTLGTFDYISPEQAHDPRDADVRSDIYSLGCTLYFLLTGQPPFPEGTALQKLLMHGTKMPEDPRCFRNDLSDPLIAILRKMMAKKPKDRYQEPIDLVHDLRTLAAIDSLSWRDADQEDLNHPAYARRSWWESSLPTLICAIAIALVTLWLYNANQLSAVYVIPRVEVADAKADESDPGAAPAENLEVIPASLPATSDKPAVPELPNPASQTSTAPVRSSQPAATLVVVGDTPNAWDASEAPYETFRSLDEALARWSSIEHANRIVLAVPTATLQRSFELVRSNRRSVLRIESAPDLRCRIVLDETNYRPSVSVRPGWLNLFGVDCQFQNVDFEWEATMGESRPTSLIAMASSARCNLSMDTLTLRHAGTGRLPSVARLVSDPANTETAPAQSSSLTLDTTSVRGQCDLLQIESVDRVEVEVRNSWVAISGSMIDTEGARVLNRSPRIRSELNHATCITLNPWLRVRMSNAKPFPVAFVRIATDSIFSGANTLVEWDASNVNEWDFASQAKRVDDLGRWIDLRGLDNVYDVPSIVKLVQVVMSMSSEEVAIDSDSNLLWNERGIELQSAWQTSPRLEATKMHLQVPRPPQGVHSGLAPGCDVGSLPTFPSPASGSLGSATLERN